MALARNQANQLLQADIDEFSYYIDALATIIKAERAEPRADADLLLTLNFALDCMKQQRVNLRHVSRMLDVRPED